MPKYTRIDNTSPMGRSRPAKTRGGFTQPLMKKLGDLRNKIQEIDAVLMSESQKFKQHNNRLPTEEELRNQPKVAGLMSRRDQLKSMYVNTVNNANVIANDLDAINKMDPVKSAQVSFSGIKFESPMKRGREYKKPLSVPAMSPSNRVSKDMRKQGTLWDPSYGIRDVSVHPRIKRYYSRLGGLF